MLYTAVGKKFAIYLLILSIMLSSAQMVSSKDASEWWNDNWSFRQEIHVPIDTTLDEAKFQAVDIPIEFDESCWAKNETKHSVRVIFQESGNLKELESQIYDINHSDGNHITECSLVFLIPEGASGKEKYYVYYDNDEKSSPDYTDHIEISEAYYRYEPIPGFPFESRYYKIKEDGYIVYGVAQQGEFLGFSTAQQITKFKAKTEEVTTPRNGESWASFDYFYYYDKGVEDFSSTIDRLISKEVFVDGNLMVKFGIVSGTFREDFQTTATYKYYYCPTESKRICVHAKHEALKKSRAYADSESFGNIAGLQCGRIRSPSIKDLNFGRMLPYLHVYSENKMIREYELDPNPEYNPSGITILSTEHDVDLGDKAWTSFDDGESGIAHSIILGSTNIVTSGTDERDGVQVQALEGASPGLLGLEADLISFYYSRNSFEKGLLPDTEVPEDFVVEFDAEFFSTETGGYKAVDCEADIFQSIATIRPSHEGNVSGNGKEEGSLSLTAFVHTAVSVPMGSTLSLLTGRNISYISAELYRDEESISTDIGKRVSINPLPSFENKRLLEKIKLTLNIFDWRNFSFFKKIRFQNLLPGKYLIKIYRESPAFGKERDYIGFQIVELTEDMKTHIFCKPGGSLLISVFDQKNNGIEGAMVCLMSNSMIIAEGSTDQKGQSTIDAPCNLLGTYVLKIFYKGFAINEEPIRLGYIRSFIPFKKSINIELHDFTLKITDTWGLIPEIELNPVITSNEMEKAVTILGEKVSPGNYLFSDIFPGTYHLESKYKSFVLEKDIEVPTEGEINLVFPAEFEIETHIYDLRGYPVKRTAILTERGEKKINRISDENGCSQFLLPPGKYTLTLFQNDGKIGKRKINVIDERTFDLITTNEPVFPYIISVASGILAIFGSIVCLRKKDINSLVKILATALAIIAVVSPWWMIYGSSSRPSIETATTLFLIPSEIVTMTSTPSVLAGELAPLPEIASTVMTLLSLAIIIGCISIMTNIAFIRYNKKKLSLLSMSFGTLSLTGSLFVFYLAISEMTKVGVGSFIGGGKLDVSIVGEEIREAVYCNWGPSIGFYLLLVATAILISTTIFSIKKSIYSK